MGETIDYEYFRNLPVEEVAEELGLDITKDHKFLCPCHNDHHASAVIQDENSKKYPNTWKCWACGEGGSPIDLVLAVKFNISPSEAKTPGRYVTEKKRAVEFLHECFGGGIIKTEEDKNSVYPKKPNIPSSVLRTCGLKSNPLHDPKYVNAQCEAADILLDALTSREDELWNYTKSVLTNFPRLGPNSSAYMMGQGPRWDADIHQYVETVRDYYETVFDIEYPEEDFINDF